LVDLARCTADRTNSIRPLNWNSVGMARLIDLKVVKPRQTLNFARGSNSLISAKHPALHHEAIFNRPFAGTSLSCQSRTAW
jgi:hypothetical protein